ncbi:ubiquinol oxidase subunit II [Candidatus Neptunichlamydia sp. REUL1]|uniref:ubiquinol oxidase subunit II n=1 Tax=Candidatus Neptunichlamydia sp. REUL1 TaxID=3064277 RepID=UPI00292CC15C|nr:ubiquinol oxidase subunit II [Candidatus Neptunochlamydia sp. REUL1]
MKRAFKIVVITLLIIAVGALTVYFVSTHNIPVLEPKGLISVKERELIITSSLLMLIVVIPVLVLAVVFGWKYREGRGSKHTPDWEHNNIAECFWWGVPVVIIIILAVITWKTSHDLNPFKPIQNGTTPIKIQAVALDWKWLFIYPDQGIATVNYVQFPEKTPIDFVVTADAPMNSFWIPQLGGQIYAMPAMTTSIHLLANETGEFEGRSANISGKGFAGMIFKAVASNKQDFQNWVQHVKSSGKELSWDIYKQLVEPSEYNNVEIYGKIEDQLFDQILIQYMPEGSKK